MRHMNADSSRRSFYSQNVLLALKRREQDDFGGSLRLHRIPAGGLGSLTTRAVFVEMVQQARLGLSRLAFVVDLLRS